MDALSRCVEALLRGDDDRGDSDGDSSLETSGLKENESFSIDCFRTPVADCWARKIWALTA